MTTVRAIRNRAAGDVALPASQLCGVHRLGRRRYLGSVGTRKVKLLGFGKPSRVLPYLLGESDDFENRDHLHWWSHGAFSSKGQLYGNQYLAGRRAPPLLHRH
jgi:hypothetical protein